ncbi:hypothetical protein Vadar_028170 [Vaccinium darrowii]|uniref:Uncharacterized protein n=1 Tax=Vaccinium darrowii TaxID=229202 RepID=A0ACB7YZ10_9ERIC|nr:hypothetical protein Vadar_028170 [Vaccinium darrowii]
MTISANAKQHRHVRSIEVRSNSLGSHLSMCITSLPPQLFITFWPLEFPPLNKLHVIHKRLEPNLASKSEERVVKVTSFILSSQDNTLPFLIITKSSCLSMWEAEFSQRKSDINIVVYKGNKDVRAIIRSLEFYNEDGCLMFQILLSTPETVLEVWCFLNRSTVAKFQAEAIYIEFLKQWNVGVYFSLRFQEIAGSLDSALAVASLVPIQISHSGKENSQNLTINQSATLLECLMSCWRVDILVLSCSDKFLRLSLQLISRYSHWVSAGLAARKASNAGKILLPISVLFSVELLSSSSTEVLDLVKQSILEGGASLKDLIPKVMNSIIQTVVEKSVEDLKQLKGITATYRMTNKPLPVRHSPYVSGVLCPLKTFLDGERATAYLTRDIRDELVQRAAVEITVRYYELAADLVSVARKTESSLQRIRQGARRRAGASSDVSDNNVSILIRSVCNYFLIFRNMGATSLHLELK